MKHSKRSNSVQRSAPKADSVRQLRSLQRAMARMIMRPLTSDHRMQARWVNGSSAALKAARWIRPNDRLTSFERLEIYNRQYWFRVLDCFYQDFPGLRAVMGDRRFERMAEDYLTRYPSQSFTLRNLGSRLEWFLRNEPRWLSVRGKMVLDVARFEWAQVVAFDEEARPVLASKDFAGKSPSQLRLHLQPYLTLLDLSYPVDRFLIALKRQSALRSEASNAVELQRKASKSRKTAFPKPEPAYIAVHRMDNSLYYKRLKPEAWRILILLKKGATVRQACARALAPTSNFQDSERVREWFQNWMSLGWFCRPKASVGKKNA